MPQPLRLWQAALSYLAGHHSSVQPESGENHGFWVPPSACLVSAENDNRKGLLFVGWLRLRKVVLFQLSCSTCHPLRWSLKKWRTMLLMVGEGRPSDQGNTVASKQRKTLRADLESSLKEAEVQLDLENLIGGQARWMDKEVKGLPPPRIAREILWELCEVNFRNDVLALDKHLDTSGMNLLDRQDLVGKCWIGTSSDVDCSTSTQAGIGASVVAMRLDYLRAMYQVVATWRCWRSSQPISTATTFGSLLIVLRRL